MFGTVEAEIAAENQHRTNVIDERNLEKYHDQLSSFNTQATLVLGFAVAGLNSDNLLALGDDQSKYCLYKSGRMGWGYAYGLSTCLSISTSMPVNLYLSSKDSYPSASTLIDGWIPFIR